MAAPTFCAEKLARSLRVDDLFTFCGLWRSVRGLSNNLARRSAETGRAKGFMEA